MKSNSTAILIKIKLRHSLGRPSRSDFVQWYFIAAADIVFALIIAFVNFKVPDTVMMSLIIYIVVLALLIVSIVRIHGYRLQCRNIKGDLTDEKI